MTTQTQSWRMFEEERADIHDFLASPEPEQWDAPSLCEGWRVRDVAVQGAGVATLAGRVEVLH